MKQWGSALFPLSILSVLALLTFWLRYATQLPEPLNDGKHRHDPDYIVSGATLHKIDESGALKYTLTARTITHYPDEDSTDLDVPLLVSLDPPKPPLSIGAERGHVSKDGVQVDLYDNVHVQRAATPGNQELNAYSSVLTVLPDDGRAYTKAPVTITKGAVSWVKGVGLQLDSHAQTYVLESQVTALIESKRAQKKTP